MNFLPYFIFGCLFIGWLCLFAWAVDYSLEGNSRWRKVPVLLKARRWMRSPRALRRSPSNSRK